MEQLNKVHLRGTVGAVRAQKMNEDVTVTRFVLATNFAYRAKDGNAFVETTWHNVTLWKDIGIKKGDIVEVVGRIRNQGYTDADGNDRMCNDILASEINILHVETLSYEM